MSPLIKSDEELIIVQCLATHFSLVSMQLSIVAL